ncbi:MAG: hypothetical protein JNN12_03810 [Bacteroidetes Order II. Incertae sedis bacterium]|nr:hypothetical protein [Bacteroidetes Order II. bacterium]
MRKIILLLLVFLGTFVGAAQAQLRKDTAKLRPTSSVFNSQGLLSKVFAPDKFRLSHSYELSTGAYGGLGLTTGMYTASMNWNLGQKLDANVDVSALHAPFGKTTLAQQLMGQDNVKVFVRNASLSYRPAKNLMLNLSFQQNPYAPYGYYGYGYEDASRFGYTPPFGNRVGLRVGTGSLGDGNW